MIKAKENNVVTRQNRSSTWTITETLLHLEVADIFSKRECMELDAHFGCVWLSSELFIQATCFGFAKKLRILLKHLQTSMKDYDKRRQILQLSMFRQAKFEQGGARSFSKSNHLYQWNAQQKVGSYVNKKDTHFWPKKNQGKISTCQHSSTLWALHRVVYWQSYSE